MKASLEFKAPRWCVGVREETRKTTANQTIVNLECRFCYMMGNLFKHRCELIHEFVDDYTDRRHPDCPLKIEEDGLRWDTQVLDIGVGNQTFCGCPKCGNEYDWPHNYCPSCGVKLARPE